MEWYYQGEIFQDLPASASPAAAGCALVMAGEACVEGGEATSSGSSRAASAL